MKLFEDLTTMNFEMIHVAASKNKMADCLSRCLFFHIVEASFEKWDKDLDQSPEVVKLFATTAILDSSEGELLDNFFLDDMDKQKVRQHVGWSLCSGTEGHQGEPQY